MKRTISIILAVCVAFSSVLVNAEDIFPDLSGKSLILIEKDTGDVLYERNADEKLPIASVTKIMTMLLIMEAIDEGKIALDEMVTVSERAMSMGGSTMFLETGEQLSVSDMLKGIAVASANDGAVAMAEHIAGSEAIFVEMMNKRAKELGMENTNFINTNGLDAEGHYSSARDVSLMSKELLKHEKIFDYTTIWMDTLRDGKFQLANTNKLIRFYDGANGLKTGSTSSAMCCISASAKRNDMQLVAVVLGAENSKERFHSASTLLDYGFANYSVQRPIKTGEEIVKIPVLKGKEKEIMVYSLEDSSILLPKGEKRELTKNINMPDYIVAPINEGDKLGEAEILIDGEVIKKVSLVACTTIGKMTYFDYVKNILLNCIL